MAFKYQAIDTSGATCTDVVTAGSSQEVADLLRERGLFVTQIETVDEEPGEGASAPAHRIGKGVKLKDVVFFTQQMAMLMRSGAQVVPALEAIEENAQRPAWGHVVGQVRGLVEDGQTLSVALASLPHVFSPVFTNMLAAGEAAGDVAPAFDRLARITVRQQEMRNRIIGALAYPVLLMLLCSGVVLGLFTFVLPRFAELFENLDADLPFLTSMMIAASGRWIAYWPLLSGIALVGGAGVAFGGHRLVKSDGGRRFVSHWVMRAPLIGPLVRAINFARICRVWGHLIGSRVDLLESVALARQTTTNFEFQAMLDDVSDAVTEGDSIGAVLKHSPLVPKTLSAALVTGEQSGKMGDALTFVADCLEEESTVALNTLTRIAEPILLVVMGLIVGTVAISLFLPLFDAAALAGG